MIRIGLTTSCGKIDGQLSSYISLDYVNAIIEKNAVPVLIPVTDNFRVIDYFLENVDGILLTGGEDIDPLLYNEVNSGLSIDICRERDRAEMYIIEQSLKYGYPILGICRGLQILNVFFGGTLYQDIPGQYRGSIEHVHTMTEREALHHEIKLSPDSYIGRIFGHGRAMVNSRHHQGVKKLGEGLIVSASADDGIIEAFEDTSRGIVAVQWHPENITGVSAGCSSLFGDLVDRACIS
ncbi:MAG TPA: gamma-glutamyl-gamma-aminobutyrate hydrolase family protein [Spirochaetota bacterium]|nr:gamma-glutamyl-gamma-aminobutyrate hydrolase family protein [Spirochaetota bacterium]